MSFHVGQLVLCIKVGPWRHGYGDEAFPVGGQVYTVRRIEPAAGDEPGLMLHEINNTPRFYSCPHGTVFDEKCFASSHFRPLDDTKLEIFRAALAPTPRKRVDA